MPAEFLDDDLNTPRALAALFDLLKRFNTLAAAPAALAEVRPAAATRRPPPLTAPFVQDVLGLREETAVDPEQLASSSPSASTPKPKPTKPTTKWTRFAPPSKPRAS